MTRAILPSLPASIRTLSTEETNRLKSRYPNLPKTVQECPTCQGKRVFLWRDNPKVDPIEYDCPCEDQWKLNRFLLNSGIDLHYQRLSWTDAAAVEKAAVSVVMEYARHATNYVSNGIGLMLVGDRGTGKTLASTLLLKMLLAQGIGGYFTTFQNMIDVFTTTWRDNAEKEWFDRHMRHAPVLVVDDVGREHKGRLEVVESMFDHILRARVAASLPTLFTSNKNIPELVSLYRLNVFSLINEVSITHEFKGADYRPQARELRIEEAKLGITRPITLA